MRRRLVEGVLNIGSGAPALFQFKGSGKTGDTPSDDGNASHVRWFSAFGFRLPDPGAEYCCTRSARFLTFSTGVSGKMPWPRLKMWPGRPSARPRISWARDLISLHSANSKTG